MKMNQLLRRNNLRNRIHIKDIIESILPNREMMKLLIMVDIRLCTNVITITHHMEMREEVEEHCKLIILMVQTLILKMDLSIKHQLQDQKDMIINSQLDKKQELIISNQIEKPDLIINHNQLKKKQDLNQYMLQRDIIEMEADTTVDKIKR